MFGVGLYSLSALSNFIYPLYMYAFEHEVVTIMPTFVPFIDENTRNGYIVLSAFHVASLILGIIACCATDLLFTMITINTPVMASLIEDEVNQLNETVEGEKPQPMLAKVKLRNILLMNRERTM